ncbi:MAG: RNA methyltransferase [Proteobacteria bacterium]|nr:RNA methyltransferase [Pseudomonadota bacterium]
MTNSSADSTSAALQVATDAVRIVLVGTTHAGNIGSSARAMKAMGFRQLAVVSPRHFPSADATAMASGADDLLADAHVTDSLEEALRGCAMVFGTTARDRHLQWPVISPAEAASEAVAAANRGPVAFVFGREASGLTNAELDLCQRAVRIPTEPTFSSLNLSQAVQICVYELRMAFLQQRLPSLPTAPGDAADPIAGASAIDLLHRHFIETMAAVGYFDPTNPRLLERRLKRLLIGANMRQSEAQIMRGFLTGIDRKLRRLSDAGSDD